MSVNTCQVLGVKVPYTPSLEFFHQIQAKSLKFLWMADLLLSPSWIVLYRIIQMENLKSSPSNNPNSWQMIEGCHVEQPNPDILCGDLLGLFQPINAIPVFECHCPAAFPSLLQHTWIKQIINDQALENLLRWKECNSAIRLKWVGAGRIQRLQESETWGLQLQTLDLVFYIMLKRRDSELILE